MARSWVDYIMVMRAPLDMMQRVQEDTLSLIQASDKTRIEEAPARITFRTDELAIEMETFSRTRQPTLFGMFCAEVFQCINFTSGSFAVGGLEELRMSAVEMLSSFKRRGQMDDTHVNILGGWSAEDLENVNCFQMECAFWSRRETPLTFMRKRYGMKDESVLMALADDLWPAAFSASAAILGTRSPVG